MTSRMTKTAACFLAVATAMTLVSPLGSVPAMAREASDGTAVSSTHVPGSWPDCGGAVVQDCISDFKVDGLAPAATLRLEVTPVSVTRLSIRVFRRPSTGPLKDTDLSELEPVLNTTKTLTIKLKLSAAITVDVVVGKARIESWQIDTATPRELTLVAKPIAISQAAPGADCTFAACPTVADKDRTAFFAAAVLDLEVPAGLSPRKQARVALFQAKFKGGFVSTSADFFRAPRYNPRRDGFNLPIGGPHFKTDGTTLNTVFYRAFVPNRVFSDVWKLDPSVLTAGNMTVGNDHTGAGLPATFTAVPATGLAPAGVLIELTNLTLSELDIAIEPSVDPDPAAATAPDDGSAPPTLPDSVDGSAVSAVGPVRVPLSGMIRVSVTVSGQGASIAFAPGTELTTSNGQRFSGDIQPPYRVADVSGRSLESVTNFIATGSATLDRTVRLSRPATITLPVPAGSSPSDFQPVALDSRGNVTFLRGRASGAGVSIEISTLSDAVAPYALARIPKPAAVAAVPPFAPASGFHSRWAGQSDPGDVAPGQIVDLTVKLANTGTKPWFRGVLGSQVALGTNEPQGNTRDFDLGVLVSPLWGKDRLATTDEVIVPPGELGTFTVRLRAPFIPGVHRVLVRPVVDGVDWLEDEGIFLRLSVK